jgi:succinate dehydrogenase hydrophobic anchor subunit
MSTTPRTPRNYRPGVIARITEGLRYGGGIGQWSWLIHRATGLGILFFLIVHVLDTFLVVVRPEWYDHTVALYGGIWFDGKYYVVLRWFFRVAELGLIASVVFHAVNGLGVILYDFWHKGTARRKEILRGVQIVFWTIMIPTSAIVIYPLSQPPKHMEDIQTDIRPQASAPAEVAPTPLPETFTPAKAPRTAALFFATMGVAVVWVFALSFVPPSGMKVRPAGGLELRAWYFMRISGLLLVFLALGHLFIMHIRYNVETINYAFIAGRWDAPTVGPLWRLWDFSLIALAVIHGFNGLRQISYEYVARPGRRVLVSTLIWCCTIGLIGVGSYAIFMFKGQADYIAKNPDRSHPPAPIPPGPGPKADPAK